MVGVHLTGMDHDGSLALVHDRARRGGRQEDPVNCAGKDGRDRIARGHALDEDILVRSEIVLVEPVAQDGVLDTSRRERGNGRALQALRAGVVEAVPDHEVGALRVDTRNDLCVKPGGERGQDRRRAHIGNIEFAGLHGLHLRRSAREDLVGDLHDAELCEILLPPALADGGDRCHLVGAGLVPIRSSVMAAGVGVVVGVAGAWVQPATSSMRTSARTAPAAIFIGFMGTVLSCNNKKVPF